MKTNKTKGWRDDETFNLYIERIRKISLLTFKEEQELSRSIKNGDENARRRLVEANLRFVVKIAFEYYRTNVSIMDLIQEGNIGLMMAVEKYDHNRMLRFSTYAAWWIRQSITRYMLDKWRIISLPHRKEETLRKIQQAYHTLSQVFQRAPSPQEISEEIGVPKADVELILSLSHETISLETINDDNESTCITESLGDLTYCPERALLRKSSRESVYKMLNVLKAREKKIIIFRYLHDGRKPQSFRNISVRTGISTEGVRQLELSAIKKLRLHAGKSVAGSE